MDVTDNKYLSTQNPLSALQVFPGSVIHSANIGLGFLVTFCRQKKQGMPCLLSVLKVEGSSPESVRPEIKPIISMMELCGFALLSSRHCSSKFVPSNLSPKTSVRNLELQLV